MKLADTPSKKALGLMFRKEPEDMLFTFFRDSRPVVWTPFMRFSIDVFFLDKSGKVLEARRNLRPWSCCRPERKCRHFFESREGKYSEDEVSRAVRKTLN